jgi:ribA/ribD-fused uncharacterized protein
MYKNKRQKPGRITDTHVFFWNSIYSQWYSTYNNQGGQFKENNIVYPNVKKYMMVKKAEVFDAYDILEQMKNTDNPRIIKALGKEIKNFSDKEWDKHKIDIVTQGNVLKFSQNSDLLEILKEHKDKIIVEASPQDKIWGIGLHWDDDRVLYKEHWQGENLLGECIMRARNKLQNLLSD